MCSWSQQPPLRHRAPGQPDDGQRVLGGRLQSRKTKHGAAGRHQDQGGYVSYRSYNSVGGGRRETETERQRERDREREMP